MKIVEKLNYSYRIGTNESKVYRSKKEDFKKWFKMHEKELDDVVVELENGDVWIYFRVKKFEKGYWYKHKNGRSYYPA